MTGRDVSFRRIEKRGPTVNDTLVATWDAEARNSAIELDFGVFDVLRGELHITHDAGLFSCLSVTLWCIADLLSDGHLPGKINFSRTLAAYKDTPGQDLYPSLFSADIDAQRLARLQDRPRTDFTRFDHHGNYRDLPYRLLTELLDIYFRPVAALTAQTNEIHDRYIQVGQRYIGVCFRGTDKGTEVLPTDSSHYLDLTARLLAERQADRVLIQTDQEQVSNLFQKFFSGRCDIIDKLPRTRGMVVIHQGDSIVGSRLGFAMDMISAVTLLSQMERVIVYTGNVGVWIALLRGKPEGVWQATPGGIFAQWDQPSAAR